MSIFDGLTKALESKGYTAASHINRNTIFAKEYDEINLPSDTIQPDGSLDLYDDVQIYLDIQYKRKRKSFVIRSNGWVGHIPLNDRHVLEVETRVPISNLERIVARSPNSEIKTFSRYFHSYLETEERPQCLFDLLTDQFLASIDQIRSEGLLKEYVRRDKVASTPYGRINVFRTAIHTQKSRTPIAVFSSFERTVDNAPNRVVFLTLIRLLQYYENFQGPGNNRRFAKLRDAAIYFDGVGRASRSETTLSSIAAYAKHIPEHKIAYIDALRVAGYIVGDYGLAIRGSGGLMLAPAIVIDMAKVFENYARNVLRTLINDSNIRVLDGNNEGNQGARKNLFTDLNITINSIPTAKPDIVIEVSGDTRLIIDVKYKPAAIIPDRSEINQILCYAARYSCKNVMILYPSLPFNNLIDVQHIGNIESFSLYRGSIDLSTDDLISTEKSFSESILNIIQ
ncbi:hypothetical protein JK222_16010 [Gluconobacter cerinus]|uniref:5-methylcytosine restriction system specificity protein McrC n=1 Tax=Gluconobacter cerinus TaxID=38307 RepID=UPI001B8B7EED|nr:hypothetical protein [Gluconobacter cerinus]MBS1073174.1 hypothetical protein [Gluconobacter cerinus]